MMNPRISLLILACAASALSCSKDVTREGARFAVTEPPATTVPGPIPTPVGCHTGTLGTLPLYSIYLSEALVLNDSTISKRIFASDASVSDTGVGTTLKADTTRSDVTVTHDLTLKSAKVSKGRVVYGRTLTETNSTALGGFVKAASSPAADLKRILDFSEVCAKTAVNTTLTRTCTTPKGADAKASVMVSDPKPQVCTLRIQGKAAGMNIAEIPLGLVAGTHVFQVEIPNGATLIASIPDLRAAAFRSTSVTYLKGVKPAGVYWNFPIAETLSFLGTKWQGTVVAPIAKMSVCTQNGDASFWGRELDGVVSKW